MICARFGIVKPEKFFGREAKRVLLVHWRDVIEPVEIGNCLQIGLMLDQFFGAAMQKPDMRIDAFHHLAVEFEHETQYAVRRRMLRAEIDGEISLGFRAHGFAMFRLPIGRLIGNSLSLFAVGGF